MLVDFLENEKHTLKKEIFLYFCCASVLRIFRIFFCSFRLVELHSAADQDGPSFATQPKGLGPSDRVLTQESGKMVFLVSLLNNLKSEGHRCLVFSQSRKMLDIIQRVITHGVMIVIFFDTAVKYYCVNFVYE